MQLFTVVTHTDYFSHSNQWGMWWCSWLRLQAGRLSVWFLMVSLEFLIDIILLAVLWSLGRLSL